MKKALPFFIFIFTLFLAFRTEAQNRNSALQFRLRNDKFLTIVIDGRHYRRYGRSITFGDVPPGNHDIKVYRFYPNDDPRYDGYRTRPRAVLLYRGRIRVEPTTMYYCTIDPQYRTMSIRESRHIPYDIDEETFPTGDAPNFLEDDEVEAQIDFNNKQNKTNRIEDPRLLTEVQLNELKTAVEERMSSNDKCQLMERYLSGKSLYTDQVIEMLSWLSFESSKLQIAKYAYPMVKDPENYLKVSNLLSFQSSKRELDKVMFKSNNTTNNSNTLQTPKDNQQKKHLQNSELGQLNNKLNNLNTDTERQKILYSFLEHHTFTVAQLAQMLDWFTFEGSKLEVAKWAYKSISNKNEFTQIRDKFSFVSSKKTIDDLMRNK